MRDDNLDDLAKRIDQHLQESDFDRMEFDDAFGDEMEFFDLFSREALTELNLLDSISKLEDEEDELWQPSSEDT